MKKLITGAIVAAALAVPATPAFAIHHGVLGFVPECAHSTHALGGLPGSPASIHANRGVSNSFGLPHNPASPRCHGVPN
jgi:hypothetical protein